MPILLRQEKQALFRSPDCPASQPWGGLEPSWGQEGQGSNRGRGEGTWARVVPGKWPQGEPPPADTPRREGCKKKKKKNFFCLFVSPPPLPAPWPPQTACASAAHLVSGFPLLLQSPEGLGTLDTGVWGGLVGGGEAFVSGLCAGCAVGVGRGARVRRMEVAGCGLWRAGWAKGSQTRES